MYDPFFSYFDSDRLAVDPKSDAWSFAEYNYKSYPRARKIVLPEPRALSGGLEEIIKKRKTTRSFSSEPISLGKLGDLLFWSAGLPHKNEGESTAFRRPHPSGGAMFPIEIYVAVHRGESVERGVYHYNIENHLLEHLKKGKAENIRTAPFYEFAFDAALSIILVFFDRRTLSKYGSLGYKAALLEAGHIAQNMYLVGAALDLGVLALGGAHYEKIGPELDLSEEDAIIYTLVVGGIST